MNETKHERPQNRNLLGPNPETLGVIPLPPGYVTIVARARVPERVGKWWKELTSEERGDLVAELFARWQEDTDESPALPEEAAR